MLKRKETFKIYGMSTRPAKKQQVLYSIVNILSSKLWSSQLWTQFKQFRIEAWKSQDFKRVWTCDPAIPVRRSNQLSYETTDVGSWSFCEPVLIRTQGNTTNYNFSVNL